MEKKKVKITAPNGVWHNGEYFHKDETPEVANAEILIAGGFAVKIEEETAKMPPPASPATIEEAKIILEAAENAVKEAETKLSQATEKNAKSKAGKELGAAKKAFEKAKADLAVFEKGNG